MEPQIEGLAIVNVNHYSFCINESDIEALFEHIGRMRYLKSLSIIKIQMDTQSARTFNRKLLLLPLLQQLNLAESIVGHQGAIAISSTLPSLILLEKLNCINNDIGSEGAIAISRALPSLRLLKQLNLNCSIGTAGAIAISQSLSSLIYLQKLIMYCNYIEKDRKILLVSIVKHFEYFDKVVNKNQILYCSHTSEK
jgi:Ran GTPase-activating protein (RanGAP) involved in mRNA processing and transport